MPNNDLPGTVDGKQDPIRASNAPQITTAAETQVSAEATPGLDLRGYELSEHLGGGGMGDVYRSGDPALGRDLAVKVMKAELQGRAAAEQRFLREARITGSLQHPGIVPIHNLGRLADGRLHYTMRLVRGRTFADILKEEAGQPERLPALLTIFEKICQAVVYAHSKRVIHRDLKPANVMVGRFGEVQVMDWGLAKLLTLGERDFVSAPGEEEDVGTRIHTEAADTPLAQTRLGREMGTPAYMPVEQALGEWDTVDERADVFALGAILCENLTGRPPYRGSDSADVLRKAKRGDSAEALARLEGCGADAALLGLCRDCLAAAREHRPRDAEQVAQRVAEYQAQVQERLRRAELERASALVQARWERKRRQWILTVAVLFLAGIGLAVWAKKAEERARENESLARESEGRALKATADALRLHEQNLKQYEAKSGPDHPDTLVSRNNLALAYRAAGRIDDALRLYEQNRKLFETKLGPDHPKTLLAMANLATTYWYAGRLKEAVPLLETAYQRGQKLTGGSPALIAWVPGALAQLYAQSGLFGKAETLSRDCLEQTERRFGREDLRTAAALSQLGASLLKQKKPLDAEPLLRQSLNMRAKRQPNDWTTFNTRSLLGEALLDERKYAEAEPLLLQGYDGMKQRQDKIPPPVRQFRLSEALQSLVRLYEATQQKDKAAEWRKKLEETKAAPKKSKPQG